MVSADPFCAAPPRSSLLDHCIDNHHHHGRASVQLLLDNSSSPPSSTSPVPAAAARNKPRSREVTSRYKSPTPSPAEIASRYRSPPPSASFSTSSTRRFATPSVDRILRDASPSPKRAVSAERRRPSPTRTGCVDAKTSSTGIGDGSPLPSRRTPPTAVGRSELLWPSTRNLYSSMQVESSSPPLRSPAKTRPERKGRSPSNLASDHTLRPSPNAAQRPADQRKKTAERKGTPLRRHSLDQAENARPSESLHSKPEPVLRHRWPSSLSSLKLYGTAMSRSVDLMGDRERLSNRASSINMLHSIPTSFSSKVIPRVIPNSGGVFSHSINDGPASSVLRTAARKLSLENKPRVSGRESPVRSTRGTPVRDGSSRISTASPQAERSVDLVRQSGEEPELASEHSAADETPAGARGALVTVTSGKISRGASVSARFMQDASASSSRTPSDAYRLRLPMPESGYTVAAGGRQLTTRQRLTPSSETRAGHTIASPWPGIPHHLTSAYKSSHQQSLSPINQPMAYSPVRSWSSPMRPRVSAMSSNRPSGAAAMLHFGADSRKGRKGLSQVEAPYLHRLLHNRLLQWRFANARADFANTTQRQAGEKLLFSVWAKTAEIRKSVITKRIKLQQAYQAHKLNSILSVQGWRLEDWSSIQQDHGNALSGAVESLEAAVLRVPVDEGVKADTQAVKEAITSAVDLVHAVEASVNRLLPKMEKTNGLMSELAQVADQERTLLEECGDLLLIASSLEVEERSLRMQLLQFEQEKARVLGHLIGSNGVNSGSI